MTLSVSPTTPLSSDVSRRRARRRSMSALQLLFFVVATALLVAFVTAGVLVEVAYQLSKAGS
jgi:hypothetical protein